MRQFPYYKLGSRIKAAMQSAGYPNAKRFLEEFAEEYNIPYITMTQYLQGRRRAPDEKLELFSKLFNVSFSWLQTGEGDPLASNSMTKKNQEKRDSIERAFEENLSKIEVINSELLTTLLEEILRIKEKYHLTEKKCATLITTLYNEVTKSTDKKLPQRNLIRTLIKMYEATL